MNKTKLTPAEAKRLVRFVRKNGGQTKAGGLVGVTSYTISRTANRHTSPSPLFRDKLVEVGVIKQYKLQTDTPPQGETHDH